MEKEVNMTKAKQIFQEICAMLDAEDWNYKKIEEALEIETGARGDDLPIEVNIRVDAKRQLVMVLSHLPYKISEEKRLDAAVAVSVINNCLVDGCLDYDLAEGHLFFRMTNSYVDSQLSREVYKYLLYCACQTIDSFNDKLLMIDKGLLTIEKFIEIYTKN